MSNLFECMLSDNERRFLIIYTYAGSSSKKQAIVEAKNDVEAINTLRRVEDGLIDIYSVSQMSNAEYKAGKA